MTFRQSYLKTTLALSSFSVLLALSTPSLAANTGKPGFNQTVFALEHALIGVGYDLGPVDGVLDPRTEKALKDYQTQNAKLEATGKMDDATLYELGIRLKQPGKAKSEQLASNTQASKEAAAKAKKSAQSKAPEEEEEDSGWFNF